MVFTFGWSGVPKVLQSDNEFRINSAPCSVFSSFVSSGTVSGKRHSNVGSIASCRVYPNALTSSLFFGGADARNSDRSRFLNRFEISNRNGLKNANGFRSNRTKISMGGYTNKYISQLPPGTRIGRDWKGVVHWVPIPGEARRRKLLRDGRNNEVLYANNARHMKKLENDIIRFLKESGSVSIKKVERAMPVPRTREDEEEWSMEAFLLNKPNKFVLKRHPQRPRETIVELGIATRDRLRSKQDPLRMLSHRSGDEGVALGDVMFVQSIPQAELARLKLRSQRMVAVNVEYRSSGDISLVELASVLDFDNSGVFELDHVFIFDLSVPDLQVRSKIESVLVEVLDKSSTEGCAPRRLKVIHNGGKQVPELKEKLGIEMENLMDVQLVFGILQDLRKLNRTQSKMMKQLGYSPDLRSLLYRYDILEETYDSDLKDNAFWDVRPLNPAMVKLGSYRVRYLFRLFFLLMRDISREKESTIWKQLCKVSTAYRDLADTPGDNFLLIQSRFEDILQIPKGNYCQLSFNDLSQPQYHLLSERDKAEISLPPALTPSIRVSEKAQMSPVFEHFPVAWKSAIEQRIDEAHEANLRVLELGVHATRVWITLSDGTSYDVPTPVDISAHSSPNVHEDLLESTLDSLCRQSGFLQDRNTVKGLNASGFFDSELLRNTADQDSFEDMSEERFLLPGTLHSVQLVRDELESKNEFAAKSLIFKLSYDQWKNGNSLSQANLIQDVLSEIHSGRVRRINQESNGALDRESSVTAEEASYIGSESSLLTSPLLVIGPPRSGKSSLLRESIRLLSSGKLKKRILVVDTFGELNSTGEISLQEGNVGESVRVDHVSVGKDSRQEDVLLSAVDWSRPDVVVVDEVSSFAESVALRRIIQQGISVIAGVRAASLDSLVESNALSPLVGDVTSSFASKTAPQKVRYVRRFPSPFRTVIQCSPTPFIGELTLFKNSVDHNVDRILEGSEVEWERRSWLSLGINESESPRIEMLSVFNYEFESSLESMAKEGMDTPMLAWKSSVDATHSSSSSDLNTITFDRLLNYGRRMVSLSSQVREQERYKIHLEDEIDEQKLLLNNFLVENDFDSGDELFEPVTNDVESAESFWEVDRSSDKAEWTFAEETAPIESLAPGDVDLVDSIMKSRISSELSGQAALESTTTSNSAFESVADDKFTENDLLTETDGFVPLVEQDSTGVLASGNDEDPDWPELSLDEESQLVQLAADVSRLESKSREYQLMVRKLIIMPEDSGTDERLLDRTTVSALQKEFETLEVSQKDNDRLTLVPEVESSDPDFTENLTIWKEDRFSAETADADTAADDNSSSLSSIEAIHDGDSSDDEVLLAPVSGLFYEVEDWDHMGALSDESDEEDEIEFENGADVFLSDDEVSERIPDLSSSKVLNSEGDSEDEVFKDEEHLSIQSPLFSWETGESNSIDTDKPEVENTPPRRLPLMEKRESPFSFAMPGEELKSFPGSQEWESIPEDDFAPLRDIQVEDSFAYDEDASEFVEAFTGQPDHASVIQENQNDNAQIGNAGDDDNGFVWEDIVDLPEYKKDSREPNKPDSSATTSETNLKFDSKIMSNVEKHAFDEIRSIRPVENADWSEEISESDDFVFEKKTSPQSPRSQPSNTFGDLDDFGFSLLDDSIADNEKIDKAPRRSLKEELQFSDEEGFEFLERRTPRRPPAAGSRSEEKSSFTRSDGKFSRISRSEDENGFFTDNEGRFGGRSSDTESYSSRTRDPQKITRAESKSGKDLRATKNASDEWDLSESAFFGGSEVDLPRSIFEQNKTNEGEFDLNQVDFEGSNSRGIGRSFEATSRGFGLDEFDNDEADADENVYVSEPRKSVSREPSNNVDGLEEFGDFQGFSNESFADLSEEEESSDGDSWVEERAEELAPKQQFSVESDEDDIYEDSESDVDADLFDQLEFDEDDSVLMSDSDNEGMSSRRPRSNRGSSFRGTRDRTRGGYSNNAYRGSGYNNRYERNPSGGFRRGRGRGYYSNYGSNPSE